MSKGAKYESTSFGGIYQRDEEIKPYTLDL